MSTIILHESIKMGNSEYLKILAENIKYLKRHYDFVTKDLADKLGMSSSTLTSYETCKKTPSIIFITRCYEILGVFPNWFLLNVGQPFKQTLKRKKYTKVQNYSGPQLQKIQEVNGLLDKDMAKIMGVSERRYMKLSLSESMLERDEIDAIVSNFDVDVSWLLYGGDNFEPKREESPKKLSDLQLSPEQYNKLLKLLDD